MAEANTNYQSWIGNTQETEDVIDSATVARIAASLRLDSQDKCASERCLRAGQLPSLWHWCFFHDPVPYSALSDDGHPQRGDFLPPLPLPRRMWAGGELQFLGPLPIGSALVRRSSIDSIERKDGRSGALIFVTVMHRYSEQGRDVIHERQDLVFREAAKPSTASTASTVPATLTVPQPSPAHASQIITPNEVTLFRYSALTFNSHRIHYDRDYAMKVEGYAGLVVHGPLLATQLADFARAQAPLAELQRFSFRALQPVFDTDAYTLCAERLSESGSLSLRIENALGQVTMRAEATFATQD